MTFDEIISPFPVFVSVIGEKWLHQNPWLDADYISSRLEHFERLERDLKSLDTHVGPSKLKATYRALVRDKNSFWPIVHEIHGISLVSKVSSHVELKIPLGGLSNRDFDARAKVLGVSINMECTTRKDEFPFNLPPVETGPNHIPVYSGSRSTVDPHDARGSGITSAPQDDPLHVETPEATVARQILTVELSQLPETGVNLILFGQISGSRENLETALFGPIAVDFALNPKVRTVESTAIRLPHGAYDTGINGEPFRRLSGVLWFKLFSIRGPEYNLYLNPCAISPIPEGIAAQLKALFT